MPAAAQRISPSSHLIAIDLGTSHVKAAIFSAGGDIVAWAWRACTLSRPLPHWCEHQPAEMLAGAYACVTECVRNADLPPDAYAALAVTGQGDGTRLIDRNGEAVRPAIIWQDARAVPIVKGWQREGRTQAIANLTGTVLCGSHQTAQLAWLAQHEPDSLRRAAHIFFAKDWLFFHLTGVVGTEQSDFSHTYLNVQTRRLEPQILELLDLAPLANKLPPLLAPNDSVARLRSDVAARLGLPGGLPVVLAPFDVVAEMISVGGSQPGIACSVMGTAGIHQVSVGQGLAGTVTSGDTTYIPGHAPLIRFIPNMLAVPNIEYWAGLFYPDVRPTPGFTGWEPLETALSLVPPGADDLLYMPFLSPSGERSPRMLPEAHAQFLGLTLNHRREHLLRAVYEGIALATADSYSHLPDFTPPLRLTGGGARSPLLAQILADVLGHDVEAHDNINGALRGAVMYAQMQLGHTDSLESAFRDQHMPCRRFKPNMAAHQVYQQLSRSYRQRVEHEWH